MGGEVSQNPYKFYDNARCRTPSLFSPGTTQRSATPQKMDNSIPPHQEPAKFSALPTELKRMILSYVVTLNVKLPPNDIYDIEIYKVVRLRQDIYEWTDNCQHILESGNVELRNIMLDLLEAEHDRLWEFAQAWSNHRKTPFVPQSLEEEARYREYHESIHLYHGMINPALATWRYVFGKIMNSDGIAT